MIRGLSVSARLRCLKVKRVVGTVGRQCLDPPAFTKHIDNRLLFGSMNQIDFETDTVDHRQSQKAPAGEVRGRCPWRGSRNRVHDRSKTSRPTRRRRRADEHDQPGRWLSRPCPLATSRDARIRCDGIPPRYPQEPAVISCCKPRSAGRDR